MANSNIYSINNKIYNLRNGRQLFERFLDIESSSGIYKPIIKSCASEKISFIFHGWTESCRTEWIPKLIDRKSDLYFNLNIYCILHFNNR